MKEFNLISYRQTARILLLTKQHLAFPSSDV